MQDSLIEQNPPYCVQVELVQGCNLACAFCGIHDIGYQSKKRGLDFMSADTVVSLVDQMKEFKWNSRIEFAVHGEPSLHPNLPLIIDEFRRVLPKAYLMLTSNGGGFLGKKAHSPYELFNVGLNTLALDNYEHANIVPKVIKKWELHKMPYFYHYPEDKNGNPHKRHSGKKISIVRDISKATAGTHSSLNNHAGSAGPRDHSARHKRCGKVFRELTVRWDGHVAICCNDWPGRYKLGHISEGLERIWQGARINAARQYLYEADRTMNNVVPDIPCNGCNELTVRPGLLPDQKGKLSVPAPTIETDRVIREAMEGAPYTTRVKR